MPTTVKEVIDTKLVKKTDTTTTKKSKLKFIDLFAGIGGFHFALHDIGMECVFASEIDEKARLTYEANFKDISPNLFQGLGMPLFNKDITKIDPKDIPDHDILCGGFPCQPFSIAGYRKGLDDKGRGDLIFSIIDIIKEKQPSVVFLENVKNLYSHDKGQTYQYIKKLIQDQGYYVTEKVLIASKFGVPTARERLYIVAFQDREVFNNFVFPLGVNKSTRLIDVLESENDQTLACVINRSDIQLNKTEKIIENSLYKPQRPIQIGIINKGGQGERIYSPLGHAITLSANGGGAAAKTGGYLINGKIRKLTIKECSRIMGFPENFIVPVLKSQAYKQFGNSVAIPVVREIAKNIKSALSVNTNNSCPQNIDTQVLQVPTLQEMVL
jgi:DNA (cytosine-5)-methyltransferase 1